MTPLQNLRAITQNMDRSLLRTASQPELAREADFFRAKIASIDTIDEFVSSPRLFNFAMKAFGLEDMTYAKAFIKKALSEGLSNRNSLANRLVDPRVRDFVRAFNFPEKTEATTKSSTRMEEVISLFVRQALEQSAGVTNPSLRLALYFQRKAPQVRTAMDILADRAMSQVVKGALALPEGFERQDIDRQARAIAQRLDIASLKDANAVNKLIERFLVRAAATDTNSTSSNPALQLIGARSSLASLTSLAATKRR
jgi:hypothetical protein